jgi:uncharacterized membrane protein
MLLALLAVRLLYVIESAMGWHSQLDPASALVDIASKGLSPAVNDATTAVLAIEVSDFQGVGGKQVMNDM